MTLGISTNTRLLGTAIITKEGLASHCIRLHKASWSPSKATQIITSLEPCVRRYSIKRVVLSIPPAHYQTKANKQLQRVIRKYFEDQGIPVHTASSDALYDCCPLGQKKTKAEAMRILAKQFPELRYYYLKEMRNKNRYYIKLFEAVVAALQP